MWVKGRPVRKEDTLTAIRELIVSNMRNPRRRTILRPFTAYYRESFTFIISISQAYN
jgi:hypothetical protein